MCKIYKNSNKQLEKISKKHSIITLLTLMVCLCAICFVGCNDKKTEESGKKYLTLNAYSIELYVGESYELDAKIFSITD